MNDSFDYIQYMEDVLLELMRENSKPFRFYEIVKMLKEQIACSELEVQKTVERALNNKKIIRNEKGQYMLFF